MSAVFWSGSASDGAQTSVLETSDAAADISNVLEFSVRRETKNLFAAAANLALLLLFRRHKLAKLLLLMSSDAFYLVAVFSVVFIKPQEHITGFSYFI